MNKRNPLNELEDARLAMELFDLAANILNRVKPRTSACEKRLHRIQRLCICERNALLVPYERALAKSVLHPNRRIVLP